MSMTEIKVTDRESFEDVCFLIQEGLAPTGVTMDGYDIVSGNERFVLVEPTREHRDVEDRDGGFHRFDALFSTQFSAGQTWETLLSDVLNYFYEKHSYLVYDPIETDENEDKAECIRRAISFLFGDKMEGRYVIEERNDEQTEGESYIYEVAIKFKLELGGIPVPVINKFYLDKNFLPLSAASCQRVYDRLLQDRKHQADDARRVKQGKAVQMDQARMQNITSSVEKLVYDSKEGIQGYLVGAAKELFEKFVEEQNRISKQSDADIEINAREFKIRYIAYIKTMAKHYVVRDLKGTPLFIVERGNNDVTILCAHCEEPLINGNVITIGEGSEQQTFVLDLSNPYTLGLTEEQWQTIAADERLIGHCQEQVCNEKKVQCKRFYCQSKLIKCEECQKLLCADCQRDEIMRRRTASDGTVEVIHIPCASFVVDTLDYEPKGSVFKCNYCERNFIKNPKKPNQWTCELCEGVVNPKDWESARELYKMHQSLLPLTMRNKENTCAEDAQKIIFGIFKKGQLQYRYILDKNECRNAMKKGKLIVGRVKK